MQLGCHPGAVQRGQHVFLDVLGLAFLQHHHGGLGAAPIGDLFRHQRVGDIEHQQRQRAVAKRIRQAQLGQRALQRVVQPTLQNQADAGMLTWQRVVQPMFDDVGLGGRDAVLDLAFLMRIDHRRVRQLVVLEGGRLIDQGPGADGRRDVVAADKAAAHMAGADAQLQHCGHVAGLAHRKGMLDHLDHARQLGARVQQQQGALHREGLRALLDHAGALAVVLAGDDQRAAQHAGRGQVGERVGRHVGADDAFPGDGAAHRVMQAGAQHRRGRRLVGAGLDMHAQRLHIGLGLHHHVQQMRHRRALVAAHIGHARLQQRLGDGQDALTVEDGAGAQAQLGHLCGELHFHVGALSPAGRGDERDQTGRAGCRAM